MKIVCVCLEAQPWAQVRPLFERSPARPAGLTTIYAISWSSIVPCSRRITKLLSANPQYEKPRWELLRWPGARNRHMALPVYEENLLKICWKIQKNGLKMTFQAISRAQNLHTPRYMAGKQFHNGHGGQEYYFLPVFYTQKFTKISIIHPSKGFLIRPYWSF